MLKHQEIHHYLMMLIDYMYQNELDAHISRILVEYLRNQSIKISVEYIEELLSFHKISNSKADAIANDILNLINN